ncbi:MAG: hypothetical protein ABIJ17_02510 [Patescibacteria group bacterium]
MKKIIILLLILFTFVVFSQNMTVETVYYGFNSVSKQTGQSFYIQISKIVIDKPTNKVFCHFDAYNSYEDYTLGKSKISSRAFEIPLTDDLQKYVAVLFQIAYKQTILFKDSFSNFNITNIISETMEVQE